MSDAPYSYWVGMDIPADTDAAALADFNHFYTNTHVREVLGSNPGFVRGRRYELAQDDARGPRGPRFLATYDIDSEAAALGYIARNDGPAAGRPKYSQGPAAWQQHTTLWRLMWCRIVKVPETAQAGQAPYIYLIGMNAPADANAADMAQFNDFYTNTHVPEVIAANGFVCGTRYQSLRAFLHPNPGAPGFLAIYGIKDEAAARAHMQSRAAPRTGGGALSAGPPVWQRHDTLWRLTYRRVE
jgi:hypothetical protein